MQKDMRRISAQVQRKERKDTQRHAKMMENEISYKVIGAAITVHQFLGPGLLESIYESALCHELTLNGLKVERQKPVPVIYRDVVIREPLILDILVENKVIIEVKAIEKEIEIYKPQLLTYLRLSGIKLGLLINFGRNSVKEGIHRVVNGL
jgi:GxxExxY protein